MRTDADADDEELHVVLPLQWLEDLSSEQDNPGCCYDVDRCVTIAMLGLGRFRYARESYRCLVLAFRTVYS